MEFFMQDTFNFFSLKQAIYLYKDYHNQVYFPIIKITFIIIHLYKFHLNRLKIRIFTLRLSSSLKVICFQEVETLLTNINLMNFHTMIAL